MASVKLTINGQEVTSRAGGTILEAAKEAGIEIPTLCHHPALKPIGACRLCLVEVSGQRTLQPACTFPAGQGQIVETESPKVVQARKFVLELIFSERNHFCMYCEMSGDCELQNLAYRYGLDHLTYPAYTGGFPVDASPAYFVLDHNRCVLCRRCIRACAEQVANHTLDLRQRGAATMVHADMDLPIGESSCIACGVCLDVCPTGALIDKRSAFMGRETETEAVKSVCSRCSLGCGIDIVTRGGNVLRIQGDWDAPVNGGLTCAKGRFEPLYENRKRILKPVVQRNGLRKEVPWELAIQEVAEGITAASRNRVGAVISTHATNEALYLASKLFVDELDGARVGVLGRAVPLPPVGSRCSLQDVCGSDAILVTGADPVRDHPVASFLVKRAVDNGANLVLLEDETSGLSPYATIRLKPGEFRKAAAILETAEHSVVLYGAGIGDEVSKLFETLEGKAGFVALQSGVNAFTALNLGLTGALDPSGIEVLFVLCGEQDWDGEEILDRIRKETFVVVQAGYASPLTERADVVLPSALWWELDGTLTNTGGLVQEVRKVADPAGETKPDWEILALLAERMGRKLGTSLEEIAGEANRLNQ